MFVEGIQRLEFVDHWLMASTINYMVLRGGFFTDIPRLLHGCLDDQRCREIISRSRGRSPIEDTFWFGHGQMRLRIGKTIVRSITPIARH